MTSKVDLCCPVQFGFEYQPPLSYILVFFYLLFCIKIGGARGVLEVPVVYWLSSLEMDMVTRVQTLDEIDCISHCTNTLGKGMNPIILPPAMGK